VIEGDLVIKVTIEFGKDYDGNLWEKQSRGKSVKVEAWLEKVMADRGEQMFAPALSDGRILARKTKGSREVVVIEFAPTIRRIIWSEDKSESDERAYSVAFPWTYLVVRFYNGSVDKMYVFYRNDPAQSMSADFCLPNLPNLYGQGDDYKICTGTISGLQTDWSLEKKLDWLSRKFWDSQFNKDLRGEHWDPSRKLTGHPQSFSEWEEKSRSDPGFILKIPWRPLGKTLQQVLDEGVA
jgi:hypothetical protein